MKASFLSSALLLIPLLTLAAQAEVITLPKYLHDLSPNDEIESAQAGGYSAPIASIEMLMDSVFKAFPLPHPSGGHSVVVSFGQAVGGTNQLHLGLDIAAPTGTPVYAVGQGTIVETSYTENLGYYVAVDHGNSLITIYGHLSSFGGLFRGAKVNAGDTIGFSGETGLVVDEVLHFAVVYGKSYVDPADALRKFGELN